MKDGRILVISYFAADYELQITDSAFLMRTRGKRDEKTGGFYAR
jgi:hypothetical protein